VLALTQILDAVFGEGGHIIGARLGLTDHLADNARAFECELDAGDLAAIEAVFAKSRDLMRIIGSSATAAQSSAVAGRSGMELRTK
jgi:hypothetical protein